MPPLPEGMRRGGTRRGASGRRGRWAWRCAVFGAAVVLGTSCASSLGCGRPPAAFVSPGASGSRLAGTRRQASVDDVQKAAEDALGSAQQSVTNVIETPGRLTKQAQETVDKTIENLKKDDGRVLDQETPAGFIGAFTVSIAVLPYIPLSFYSTYLLATTGRGVPAGPQGLFGYAEGIATVVVFFVCLWSFVSLLTRARGLPPGAFNLLGATQSLSWLAAFSLLATIFTNGGKTTPVLAGLKDVKLPAISLPKDFKPPSLPGGSEVPNFSLPDLSKFSLPSGGTSSTPSLPKFEGLSQLQEGLSKKIESAKEQVSEIADKAKDKAKEVTAATPKLKAPEAKSKAPEGGAVINIEDLFS